MNPERLLQNFDRLTDTPDAVPRLRRFILDLAVRGKLVEQNPEDEPAAELLKRIEAEKKRLEKKEKVLAKIKPDEVPFSLFDNLVLVRLGEIAAVEKGITGIQKASPGPYPLVSLASDRSTSAEYQFDAAAAIVPLISSTGHGHASIKRLHYQEGKFALGNILCAVLPYCHELVSARYLFEYLTAYKDDLLVSKMLGTANVSLTISKIAEVPVPLITPKSQQRLDELMALCDELEAAQAKRERRRDRLVAATLHGLNNGEANNENGESFDFEDSARFYFNHLPHLTTRPEHIQQLRQAILNLAVRGKLVPQDPKDESASALLKRLFEKKAKEQHQLQVIEVPAKLPESWAWTKTELLCEIIVDCPHSTPKFIPEGIVCLDTNAFKGGLLIPHKIRFVSEATYRERVQRLTPRSGDIVFAREGSVGESVIVPEGMKCCLGQRVMLFRPFREVLSIYFQLALSEPSSLARLIVLHKGIGAKHVNVADMRNALIPLPPLLEQHRIVAKVNELMALCNEMETRINTNTTTKRKFLEATLQEALNGNIQVS